MLRPERMSRVSVTGSKPVMDDVIEAVHDLNLLHVTEYDGSWDGFDPGDPIEGADDASEKLVTVRSLQSILDVDEEDAGPTRLVTDEALEDELEEVRQEVNELDDRRSDIEDQLRAVEERLDAMEPFVALGIDLDLLGGYDTLAVEVGEGDADTVRSALEDAGVETYRLFVEDGYVAVFARTDEDTLSDALVNADFSALEVPDVTDDLVDVDDDDGAVSPEEYRSQLEHRRQQLESKLTTAEDELEDLRLDVAGFLLAAEEKLSIEVQKREAPLTFATTDNAFVAEGWIPTEEVDRFESELASAVGDSVEVEELERADYDGDGHPTGTEHVEHDETGGRGQPATADGSGQAASAGASNDAGASDADDQQAATDGGVVRMSDEEPPVVQDNPGPVRPFETLVEVINRPKYSELDPTVVLFLTFPAMFGFMIGDLGYGLLYFLGGLGIYKKADNDAVKSLGGVGAWAGAFTMLFGVLYGEIFGLHLISTYFWEGVLGMGPPMHKGLQPAEIEFAMTWLTVSVLAGLFHLTVGYVFGFVKELSHGLKAAVLEKGSWIVLMGGVWTWIFSHHAGGVKPEFLFSVFAGEPFALGFAGFSATVGLGGLGAAALGFVMLLAGEGAIGALESLNVLVNVLSYTRIAAVLLAKAGMAFVVNLLFFGAYSVPTGHGGAEYHFMLSHGAEYVTKHHHEATIMFPGLIHSGVAGLLGGVVVLLLGHLLVLALGITSAGLQAVRLEYVEFFGKFYEGGGKSYDPFGYERTYTTEN